MGFFYGLLVILFAEVTDKDHYAEMWLDVAWRRQVRHWLVRHSYC